MTQLSVIIITRNEELNIRRCLDSLKGLANEILVVDDNSSDRTAEICRAEGCRVMTHDFEGFGRQKQYATENALYDWVLSVDADEVVTPELSLEIKELMAAAEIPNAGYRIPFSVFYLGRRMKHSGMGKESHLRLFDRRKGRFTIDPVHEGIVVEGPAGRLLHPMHHYSYRDLFHHLDKINLYTTAAAEGYVRKGKKFNPWTAALKFPVSFFTFYFIKGGILDGYPGFMWSFLAAVYGSLKIAKTIELSKPKA